MTLRTDLQYKNGGIQTSKSADLRKQLPTVSLTPKLASDKWAVGIMKDIGEDNAADPDLSEALNLHKRMVSNIKSVVSQRDNQSPDLPQSRHLNDVNNAYQRIVKGFSSALETTRTRVADKHSKLDAEFESKLKFNNSQAVELRSILRSMNDVDRMAAINQAVDDGNGNLLAAVLDSDPLAVGIKPSLQTSLRSLAMQKHAPSVYKLKEALKKADELVFGSFTDLIEAGDSVTAKAIREEYQRQAQQAEEAKIKSEFL
ncbi:hypothetical protein QX776_03150 [Alteromonadaceae bacterium BrNp21-10]|nr:hypothetical protein [Alteromonadaceae bacterium BrNp21-10]